MNTVAVDVAPEDVAGRTVRSQSPTAQAWRRFRRHPLAVVGLVMFGIVLLATVFAPVIARYDYATLDLQSKFQPPSSAHFFGTDRVGRDIWSRTLYGGRVSLAVGFAAAIILTLIGVVLGSISGYYRGLADQMIMRFTDVVMTFPSVVIILTASIYLGQSVFNVIMLIGIFNWPGTARLVRGQVLSLREQQFVLASRAVGANNWRIITTHILPNVIAPLLASVTFAVNGAILLEAGLSFLGFGIPLPTPSWGNMLDTARSLDVLQDGPWIWVPPAVMIILTVLSINFIGDGLRDAIDPRHQQG